MCGWFSAASTCASRRKRAMRSGSCVKLSGRIFSATSRFSFVSRARYTWPYSRAGVFFAVWGFRNKEEGKAEREAESAGVVFWAEAEARHDDQRARGGSRNSVLQRAAPERRQARRRPP